MIAEQYKADIDALGYQVAGTSRDATVVLGMTLANRGLGYLRDALMTAALGTTPGAQIFVYSFRIFGTIRAIISEAAIPAVVIHDYPGTVGAPSSWGATTYIKRTCQSWVLLILLLSVGLAALNPCLMGQLLPVAVSRQFSSSSLTIFSIILGTGLAVNVVSAVFSGLLQAEGRFFGYSVLSLYLNLGLFALFGFLLIFKDFRGLHEVGVLVAAVFLLTGFSQIAQGMKLTRVHPRSVVERSLRLRTIVHSFGQLRDLARNMVPISLYTVTSPLISLFITASISARGENIAHFFIAERVIQLIPGTVGYALGVVLLPKFVKDLRDNTRVARGAGPQLVVLAVVSAFLAWCLHLLAKDLIFLLYTRSNFQHADAIVAARYLSGMAFSIFPMMLEPTLVSRQFAQLSQGMNYRLFGMVIAFFIVVLATQNYVAPLWGLSEFGKTILLYNVMVSGRVIALFLTSHFSPERTRLGA